MSDDRPDWLPEKYATPEEFRKGFDELSAVVGRKGVMPAPDDPVEAWDEAMSKLIGSGPEDWRDGNTVPKDAKDYGLAVPEGFEGAFEGVLDDIHGLGLTKGQAKKAWEARLEAAKAAADANAAAKAAKADALDKAFGAGLERKKAEANAALAAYGDDAVREFFGTHGENPEVLAFLSKIGATLGEDRVSYLDAARSGRTPEEIETERTELRRRKLELASKAMHGNLPEMERKESIKIDKRLVELGEMLPGGSDPANVVASASSR